MGLGLGGQRSVRSREHVAISTLVGADLTLDAATRNSQSSSEPNFRRVVAKASDPSC